MPGVSRNTAYKRKWSTESMSKAVEAVKGKKLSLRDASRKYGVSKSSLHDRIRGRVEVDRRPGPKTILTPAEEQLLVSWVLEMASIGFGVRREKVVAATKSMLDKQDRKVPLFKDNLPGKDWWYGFLRRHPRLSESGALEMGRAKLCSRETLDRWYTKYSGFLERHGIVDSSQVYCCDETSFPFDARTRVIDVGSSQSWHDYEVESNSKGVITSMVCASADGHVLPPFHIFPGQYDADVMQDSVPNAHFGFTQDGSIDTTQFGIWLTTRFCHQIPCRRPIVLLLDENPAHFDLSVAIFCKENDILMYCLPHSSSQVTQPLCAGFFESLKNKYYKRIAQHNTKYPDSLVTTVSFAGMFRMAWMDVSVESVVNGFKSSGIWPVNKDAIPDKRLQPSSART